VTVATTPLCPHVNVSSTTKPVPKKAVSIAVTVHNCDPAALCVAAVITPSRPLPVAEDTTMASIDFPTGLVFGLLADV
jgi:hypothetical protein